MTRFINIEGVYINSDKVVLIGIRQARRGWTISVDTLRATGEGHQVNIGLFEDKSEAQRRLDLSIIEFK